MDMLKQIFPFSFAAKNDLTALIINIVVYIAVGAVVGFVLGLLGQIPFIGFLFSLIGWVVGLYCLVGIVLAVLDYMKVLK